MATESNNWTEVRLVVVDVEGNGGRPPELVELAIVAIENGLVAPEPSEWLVRPEVPISPIVSRLHKITNKMVADAPRFADVTVAVRKALNDDYFIAHNAHVDLDVLTRQLPGWEPRGVIDTLRLARQFLPGRKSHSLSALVEDLHLVPPRAYAKGPHRAGYDALVTARLFLELARDDNGDPRPFSILLNPKVVEYQPKTEQGTLF